VLKGSQTQLKCLTADCIDLANSKQKVLALGEFLTTLWSAMQVQYACTARVIHVDHNLTRNSPSAQHFPLWIYKVNANSSILYFSGSSTCIEYKERNRFQRVLDLLCGSLVVVYLAGRHEKKLQELDLKWGLPGLMRTWERDFLAEAYTFLCM